jgi:drug/metabolite transporter (DMT)-like permease
MFQIYFFLIAGVLTVSWGSILVRWVGPVPFAVIAFYRLFFCMVVLLIVRMARKDAKESFARFHWHYLLAGVFLATHLITWIASLQMTSIANSIFLEGTHPVFAVLFSIILLKEYPRRITAPFFLLAVTGMFLIVYTDVGAGKGKLLGDFLAVLSAMLIALYLCIARIHKQEPDLIKYLIYVYGAASVVCLVYLKAVGNHLTGYPLKSWVMMVLLALGPNLIGHSLLNWASRRIEVYKVNLALLLEPVLATLSGMIFVYEFPGVFFYVGAVFILLSVGIIIWLESRKD